jgi:hypothetical protein
MLTIKIIFITRPVLNFDPRHASDLTPQYAENVSNINLYKKKLKRGILNYKYEL